MAPAQVKAAGPGVQGSVGGGTCNDLWVAYAGVITEQHGCIPNSGCNGNASMQ